MTDTISHTKYSYLTHMEWKDPPPPQKKRKEKKREEERFFIFLSRWKYSL